MNMQPLPSTHDVDLVVYLDSQVMHFSHKPSTKRVFIDAVMRQANTHNIPNYKRSPSIEDSSIIFRFHRLLPILDLAHKYAAHYRIRLRISLYSRSEGDRPVKKARFSTWACRLLLALNRIFRFL